MQGCRILQWNMLVYITRPFGLFYCYLVYFMVIWYIFPFWDVVPRKIWQPCLNSRKERRKQVDEKIIPLFTQAAIAEDAAATTAAATEAAVEASTAGSTTTGAVTTAGEEVTAAAAVISPAATRISACGETGASLIGGRRCSSSSRRKISESPQQVPILPKVTDI
jgi:hypothetical protein